MLRGSSAEKGVDYEVGVPDGVLRRSSDSRQTLLQSPRNEQRTGVHRAQSVELDQVLKDQLTPAVSARLD